MSDASENASNDANKKGFTFTAHNFEAMNKAIDTEVEKRFEISELYQHQQTSRRTLILLHITLSLCVILLTFAVIYWLFFLNNGHIQLPITPNISKSDGIRDRETYAVLDSLSIQEQATEAEQSFINTSFTVFHRTLIPTGEYAVTGKTFQPDNLRIPSEQYCYLEKDQQGGSLSATPLAVIEETKFILETEEPELMAFAKRYCQFSL